MAVKVNITGRSVTLGLAATPDTVLWRARDGWMHDTMLASHAAAPINNPLNAVHRGGIVGTYAASFHSHRTVSARAIGFVAGNRSEHASVVEWGRSGSSRPQRFSSVRSRGVIEWHNATRARAGQYVMTDAVNYAMRGVATPLPAL